MKLEQREEEAIGKKVGPLVEKVNELMEQNKVIAEGMVAIADMVKEMKEGKKSFEKSDIKFNEPSFEEPEPSFRPAPMQQPIQPVRFVPPKKYQQQAPGFGAGPIPPPPGMPPEAPFDFGPEPFPPFEEPFPPLGAPKKKGFIGIFKKK